MFLPQRDNRHRSNELTQITQAVITWTPNNSLEKNKREPAPMNKVIRRFLIVTFSLLLANCALLHSHSKATRLVTLEGVEMTAEAAAQELFGRAMEARQDKNDEAAKHLLRQIIKNYDDSLAAKTAHVELARIFLDQRQPLRAQRIFWSGF